MPRAIRITSASGALTVNVTGPAGTAPVVYADSTFSATTSLPATIGDGATSTLWLKSPGAYTLSVKTASGTEIAGDNNQTRTVDLETPDTIAALSYDTRFTHRIEGDSGRGSDTGDTNAAYAPIDSPAFTTAVALPGGGVSRRRPVNGSVVIDGAAAATLPGDKVAYSLAATIKGGFSGDTGGNPGFAWGADDFIVTGTTSGDVAGINNLIARETELHLYTPGAAIGSMKGLQVDCKVEAAAIGATVTTMFGIYVSPVSAAAGTVTTAYGLYVDTPTAGATNEALHVVGVSNLVGATTLNGAVTVTGALTQTTGSARFTGPTTPAQGMTAGAYIGGLGGPFGILLADGTNTFEIDNNSGNLRILKAGVAQVLNLDLSGNMKVWGGVGFYNTAPTTKQTVTGSRGANAALASLLTALAAYGLVTDSSTA